jgi:hypothetical protein
MESKGNENHSEDKASEEFGIGEEIVPEPKGL